MKTSPFVIGMFVVAFLLLNLGLTKAQTNSESYEKYGLALTVVAPEMVQPSSTVKLTLSLDIPEGFHIYGTRDKSYPTRVKMSESAGYEIGEASIPKGVRHAKPNGGTNYWIEGRQEITQEIKLSDSASGELKINGVFDFMICDKRSCKPPAKFEFEVSTTVKSNSTKANTSKSLTDVSFQKPFRLKANGKAIEVESPGYAAPCLADIDADGRKDLLVGQFNGGKIKVYKGLENGEFGKGKWLKAEGKVAKVPGVW